MALCFVMMFGRIGAVVGSNFVGVILNSHCNIMFGIFTSLLIGEFVNIKKKKKGE